MINRIQEEPHLIDAIEDASCRFEAERGHKPRSIHISRDWLKALWDIPMDIDSLEICGKKVFIDNSVKGKVVYCVDHSK